MEKLQTLTNIYNGPHVIRVDLQLSLEIYTLRGEEVQVAVRTYGELHHYSRGLSLYL